MPAGPDGGVGLAGALPDPEHSCRLGTVMAIHVGHRPVGRLTQTVRLSQRRIVTWHSWPIRTIAAVSHRYRWICPRLMTAGHRACLADRWRPFYSRKWLLFHYFPPPPLSPAPWEMGELLYIQLLLFRKCVILTLHLCAVRAAFCCESEIFITLFLGRRGGYTRTRPR